MRPNSVLTLPFRYVFRSSQAGNSLFKCALACSNQQNKHVERSIPALRGLNRGAVGTTVGASACHDGTHGSPPSFCERPLLQVPGGAQKVDAGSLVFKIRILKG